MDSVGHSTQYDKQKPRSKKMFGVDQLTEKTKQSPKAGKT